MQKTTITFDAYDEGLTADERDQIYELLIQFGDNIEIEESEE